MGRSAIVIILRSIVRKHGAIHGRECDADKIPLLAPASTAIEYERQTIVHNLADNSKYRGPPRPEQDEAWEDLLQCT